MKVTPIEEINTGGFATVWKGTDELGRTVAIKTQTQSSAAIVSPLDHAGALARVDHPNVVKVYSVETLPDPTGDGTEVEAVIMEYVPGPNLAQRAEQGRMPLDELRAIGLGIIDGLAAIHDASLVHRDLHEANIVLGPTGPKIIDIFYRDSLALLSQGSQSARMQRDLDQLRLVILFAMRHSALDPADVSSFNQSLSTTATVADIRVAFERAVDPLVADAPGRHADHAYQRLVDPNFVEGQPYAEALANETQLGVEGAVLRRLIAETAFDDRHAHYVRALWARAHQQDKQLVIRDLAAATDREVPAGTWYRHLKMLNALGREGWNNLPAATRIRLEATITKDILAGSTDKYHPTVLTTGVLGTYANLFYPYFTDQDRLVQTISSMLHQSWFTQNYIAQYFMPHMLTSIATTPERRQVILDGLKSAISNDAHLVARKIVQLPPDWIVEIQPSEPK